MKPLKVLVLAATVAAALIALIAASTASATVLCSEQGTGSPTGSNCPTGKAYAAGTSLHAVASGVIKLTTTFKTVECNESTIAAKTENEGKSGEAVKANVETLSFGSCNCTVTTLKKGSLSLSWISGSHNGTLSSTGAEITASCSTIFGTIHCLYATENTDLGTATGGNPSKIDIEGANVPRLTTNALCAEKGSWDATYEITSPKPLYYSGAVGSGATETTLTTSLSGEEKSGEEITVNEGAKVKDTATLSGANASKATGTVKYKVYADKECKELVTNAGEVTVSEGKVPASEEKELEAGRVYYWQAEYSGDSNNLKSTSPCGKEVLTIKAATSISTLLTAGEETGEVITLEEEMAVTDAATLSGTKSSAATGKVKYRVYSDLECAELVAEAGEVTVSEGEAPASEPKTLEPGIYFWRAEYAGDATHNPSTSECGEVIEEVQPANVTLHEEKATGAALAVKSEVKGSSGTLVFQLPSKELIECAENTFVGKVLQNQNATAVVELTSWEFKKGGAEGERCKTTMKVGGKPVDAVITPLVMGTLRLWPGATGASIRPFEIKLELYVEKTLQLTCRYGSALVPAGFNFNAALGLTLSATGNHALGMNVAGSQKACETPLSFSGGLTVTTKPGGKAVVPTSP